MPTCLKMSVWRRAISTDSVAWNVCVIWLLTSANYFKASLIATHRLAGLKIIIFMKINASYFEFRSVSRNVSRGQNFFQYPEGYWACDFQYPKLKSAIAGISGYRKFEALCYHKYYTLLYLSHTITLTITNYCTITTGDSTVNN